MDKETYTFEDRVYVNPETSRDEQLGFIEKLRGLQQEGAEKIERDTHNLGTDVTPNLGGLNGAEALWSGQYVTPKVESMASSLRSAAQAQALNDVLSNYQAQMKKRYNDAYRAAQKRAAGGGGGGGTGGGGGDDSEGDLEWKASDSGKLDPNGVDKVEKRPGAAKANPTTNTMNDLSSISGGGKLPNSNTRTFYLQAPNGKKEWVVVRNTANGTGIDTEFLSMDNSDSIRKFIGDRIRAGYNVVDARGKNYNSTYSLVWGL